MHFYYLKHQIRTLTPSCCQLSPLQSSLRETDQEYCLTCKSKGLLFDKLRHSMHNIHIEKFIFLMGNRHIWHCELEEIAEDIIARGGIPFTQGGYLLLSHSRLLEGSQLQGLMACQLKLHKSKTTICSVENYQLVAFIMPLPQQTLFCTNI